MNEEDNSNSITILNHKLTIADMIEQTYYNATMCNINNNTKRFNELYYTHLNEIDKQKWHNFMKQFYIEIDIITPTEKINETKTIIKNIIILLFIFSIDVIDRIKATNYNLTVLLKRFVVFVNQNLFYIFLVVHYIPYNN